MVCETLISFLDVDEIIAMAAFLDASKNNNNKSLHVMGSHGNIVVIELDWVKQTFQLTPIMDGHEKSAVSANLHTHIRRRRDAILETLTQETVKKAQLVVVEGEGIGEYSSLDFINNNNVGDQSKQTLSRTKIFSALSQTFSEVKKRKGRPQGRKDTRVRTRSKNMSADLKNSCALSLLKLLLVTQQEDWKITDETCQIFALTTGFQMWKHTENLDVLRRKLVDWLKIIKDIVVATEKFTKPFVSDDFKMGKRGHTIKLAETIAAHIFAWIEAGSPLDFIEPDVMKEIGGSGGWNHQDGRLGWFQANRARLATLGKIKLDSFLVKKTTIDAPQVDTFFFTENMESIEAEIFMDLDGNYPSSLDDANLALKKVHEKKISKAMLQAKQLFMSATKYKEDIAHIQSLLASLPARKKEIQDAIPTLMKEFSDKIGSEKSSVARLGEFFPATINTIIASGDKILEQGSSSTDKILGQGSCSTDKILGQGSGSTYQMTSEQPKAHVVDIDKPKSGGEGDGGSFEEEISSILPNFTIEAADNHQVSNTDSDQLRDPGVIYAGSS